LILSTLLKNWRRKLGTEAKKSLGKLKRDLADATKALGDIRKREKGEAFALLDNLYEAAGVALDQANKIDVDKPHGLKNIIRICYMIIKSLDAYVKDGEADLVKAELSERSGDSSGSDSSGSSSGSGSSDSPSGSGSSGSPSGSGSSDSPSGSGSSGSPSGSGSSGSPSGSGSSDSPSGSPRARPSFVVRRR
jgi:hypothetical protein